MQQELFPQDQARQQAMIEVISVCCEQFGYARIAALEAPDALRLAADVLLVMAEEPRAGLRQACQRLIWRLGGYAALEDGVLPRYLATLG